MATNKETMVVIAEGVGFHDPTEAENLAGEIAVRIAFDASDNFMTATEGMKLKTVQAIVKDLEEAEPESMIAILILNCKTKGLCQKRRNRCLRRQKQQTIFFRSGNEFI